MTQIPVLSSNPTSTVALVPFSCTRSRGRLGAVWIRLTGELDLANASVAADEMRKAQASSYMVAVDLRELEFIDCAGLGVLVTADAEARRARKSLVVIRGVGQVDRMLSLTGLREKLEVVDLRAQRTERPILGATVGRPMGAGGSESAVWWTKGDRARSASRGED